MAHNGAANGNALTLPTREFRRTTVKQLIKLQDTGGFTHARINCRLVLFVEFQAKGHVFIDRHMRIQRIGLEYHGNATIPRAFGIYQITVDHKIATGDILKSGNNAQQG